MDTSLADLRRLDVPALVRRHACDARRVERILAGARVALCSVCVVTAWIGTRVVAGPALPVRSVLAAYGLESIGVAVLVARDIRLARRLPLVLHAIDFLAAFAITFVTAGLASPFFPLFLFVTLAAAYRWRSNETLTTGTAALAAIGIEASWLAPAGFDAEGFLLGGTYIAVAAVLLGFLAEDEKRRRAEVTTAGDLLAAIQGQTGFRPALRLVCGELLDILDAHHIVIAAREIDAERVVLWTAARGPRPHPVVLTSSEISYESQDTYFWDAPGDGWSIFRRRGGACVVTPIDRDGRVLRKAPCTVDPAFWMRHPAAAALGISIGFGGEWRGRVFLLRERRFSVQELRFAHRVLCSLVPAMHSQYLVRRLRSEASAAERRRVARELHDGVIQTLIGLELQVAALRRQTGARDPHVDAQLHLMQRNLGDEARAVRDVMHQIRPVELGPRELVPAMAEIVERFGRETGITAAFHADAEVVPLAPGIARELVRTLQEALTNVRKHAAARRVDVRLAEEHDAWRLTIGNDGWPFTFSGRLTLEELDAGRIGPRVIKERVREMGATMAIESSPGRGVTIDIALPRQKRERRSA